MQASETCRTFLSYLCWHGFYVRLWQQISISPPMFQFLACLSWFHGNETYSCIHSPPPIPTITTHKGALAFCTVCIHFPPGDPVFFRRLMIWLWYKARVVNCGSIFVSFSIMVHCHFSPQFYQDQQHLRFIYIVSIWIYIEKELKWEGVPSF